MWGWKRREKVVFVKFQPQQKRHDDPSLCLNFLKTLQSLRLLYFFSQQTLSVCRRHFKPFNESDNKQIKPDDTHMHGLRVSDQSCHPFVILIFTSLFFALGVFLKPVWGFCSVSPAEIRFLFIPSYILKCSYLCMHMQITQPKPAAPTVCMFSLCCR